VQVLRATRAKTEALPADKLGKQSEPSLNYANIIGMLQYLQAHTRPKLHLQAVKVVDTCNYIQTCI